MYIWHTAKMRASRLLSILMLLQTRRRMRHRRAVPKGEFRNAQHEGCLMSATGLAQHLEVSQRTILRDIDQLSAAGVPVWSDRGRDGGFQLRAGWSTQLTGPTDAEAKALSLAGLPSAATRHCARLALARCHQHGRGRSDPASCGVQTHAADWVQVVIPIESVQHATMQLLGMGAHVQVLEPASLRDRMRETLAEMSALYAA